MEGNSSLISNDLILRSPLPDIDIPSCDFWTFISRRFGEFKDKEALRDPVTEQTVTYKELNETSRVIAQNLHVLRFNLEKPVIISMANCFEFIHIIFAVWRLNGVCAVINPTLKEGEIKLLLDQLDAELIFATDKSVDEVLRATTNSDLNNMTIISCEEHEGCLPLSQFLKPQTNNNSVLRKRREIKPNERTLLIVFSSGSTGKPKATAITHTSFTHAVIARSLYMKSVGNTGLIARSMAHQWPLLQLMHFIFIGGKIILTETDLNEYASLIKEYKVKLMCITPSGAFHFCKSGLISDELQHLTLIQVGGAPLNAEIKDKLSNLTGPDTTISQLYGMTELALVSSPLDSYAGKQGSVGMPTSNTMIKIVDCDLGKSVGPNINGEICVKKTFAIKGYYKNEEATRAAVDAEGWLHTGDYGHFDEDGYLFIVDRIKEIIKVGGIQVSPSELEAVVLNHPGITEVAITSIPDPESGELPFAWIVAKTGVNITEEDVQQYVNERVSSYKSLRGGIRFVESIPKTLLGKIARMEIKEQTRLYLKTQAF